MGAGQSADGDYANTIGGMDWYLISSTVKLASGPVERRTEPSHRTFENAVESAQALVDGGHVVLDVTPAPSPGGVPWRLVVMSLDPTNNHNVYLLWPKEGVALKEYSQSSDRVELYVHRITSSQMHVCARANVKNLGTHEESVQITLSAAIHPTYKENARIMLLSFLKKNIKEEPLAPHATLYSYTYIGDRFGFMMISQAHRDTTKNNELVYQDEMYVICETPELIPKTFY